MKKKIRAWFRKYADDLFFFAGCFFILEGAYSIHPIAAWFTAGAECLVIGFLIVRSKGK